MSEQEISPSPIVEQSSPVVEQIDVEQPKTPPKQIFKIERIDRKIRQKKSNLLTGTAEHAALKKTKSVVTKQSSDEPIADPVVTKINFDEPIPEVTPQQPVQEQDDMEVDPDDSVVEEFEQIPNDKQREMAYIARRALKTELLKQANTMVSSFLGDEFNPDQKVKISSLVTRLYDEPKSLFQAIKHAHKGILKNPYKNLGKVRLLDASKAISKVKTNKISMFRQFLQQRMN